MHEYRVRRFTAVYTPKDRSHTYPMLMKRTPYSVRPYGKNKYPKVLGPSLLFAKERYIFVNQDVRGRFQSEGKFVHVTPHIDHKTSDKQIDESSDTFDTISWLLKNVPNHNGRVGQWGISYPGFYAAAGMIDAHPALKAVSLHAPVSDWFVDDVQHHGSFFLAHAFPWLSSNSGPRTGPTIKTPNNSFTPRGESIGGYQMLVRSEVIRGRFRNSNEHPEPFVPGRPTRVSLELQDVLHRFEPGHRLMVQIQSTWFPLVDRNPQKYVENIFLAGEKDFRTATQRVYHSVDHASRLRVRVLEPVDK